MEITLKKTSKLTRWKDRVLHKQVKLYLLNRIYQVFICFTMQYSKNTIFIAKRLIVLTGTKKKNTESDSGQGPTVIM